MADSILNQLVGGRLSAGLFTNKSGSQVVAGDAVVIDPANSTSFKTSTVQGDMNFLGVAMETIANNSAGRVAFNGICQAYVKGTAAVGDYLRHSGTAKQLESVGSTPVAGVVGQAVSSGTDAILYVKLNAQPYAAVAQTYNTYTTTNNSYQTYGTYQTYNVYQPGIIGLSLDGGGSYIAAGFAGYLRVPKGGTVTKWTVMTDSYRGYLQLDLWKTPFASFPPTVANTITGTDKPRVQNQAVRESTALTGWTTSINDGDVIAVNIDSATYITKATAEIEYNRNP